jgi:hypothetical protein
MSWWWMIRRLWSERIRKLPQTVFNCFRQFKFRLAYFSSYKSNLWIQVPAFPLTLERNAFMYYWCNITATRRLNHFNANSSFYDLAAPETWARFSPPKNAESTLFLQSIFSAHRRSPETPPVFDSLRRPVQLSQQGKLHQIDHDWNADDYLAWSFLYSW